MGKWGWAVLVWVVVTGCSSSSSPSFQSVVAVAGDWQFRTTTTTVTPGSTLPPFPLPTAGGITTGEWRLSQNATAVSGQGVNATTGVAFSLNGDLQDGTLTLAGLGSNPSCGPVWVGLNLRLNSAGTTLLGTGITEVGSCFRSEETLVATRIL